MVVSTDQALREAGAEMLDGSLLSHKGTACRQTVQPLVHCENLTLILSGAINSGCPC